MNSKDQVPLMKDPVILEIAKNHNKTAAQVLIRWAIQQGTVCIPKSIRENRIKENFDVFDLELTSEEMQEIRAMGRDNRFVDPTGLPGAGKYTIKEHWENE